MIARIWVAVLCFGAGCGVGRAQAPVPPPASTSGQQAAPHLPLPAASTNSPVTLFRELLAMSPAERKDFLASRPPENQKLILAKVREYESLKPNERELRLKVTELRWYLRPLMTTPPANRAPLLGRIPEDTRKLVEERLADWDKLPAATQQELINNEAAIRYFLETESADGQATKTENLTPERRRLLETGVEQWQQMPDSQRRKLLARFQQYFTLTSAEQERALGTLSEPERKQMEKTLRSFGRLSQVQRAQCLRSFEKFASLSLEDRQQFLKNAEKWKLMKPNERKAWIALVERLSAQPPLPPGLQGPPMPPIPRAAPRRAEPMATNSN